MDPTATDDIAQIVDLAHAYNQAVDDHDPDGWVGCFTEDGEVISPFGNPSGRDELHRWISGIAANLTGTRHFSANEVVTVAGDRATMRSYYFVVGTTEHPPAIGATGGYDDELVRLDGGWRFARRIHTVDASFQGEGLAG
jgi:uncharacterized protein (TIGR02246 family)